MALKIQVLDVTNMKAGDTVLLFGNYPVKVFCVYADKTFGVMLNGGIERFDHNGKHLDRRAMLPDVQIVFPVKKKVHGDVILPDGMRYLSQYVSKIKTKTFVEVRLSEGVPQSIATRVTESLHRKINTFLGDTGKKLMLVKEEPELIILSGRERVSIKFILIYVRI